MSCSFSTALLQLTHILIQFPIVGQFRTLLLQFLDLSEYTCLKFKNLGLRDEALFSEWVGGTYFRLLL